MEVEVTESGNINSPSRTQVYNASSGSMDTTEMYQKFTYNPRVQCTVLISPLASGVFVHSSEKNLSTTFVGNSIRNFFGPFLIYL